MERKVLDFIRRHALVTPGQTVVVGVSGGADSVCLLHILHMLAGELDLKLHAAHLDHGLRGDESEADTKYVEALAQSMGVPVTVETADVAGYGKAIGASLEEAARELRYRFLAKVARRVAAERIAVGHTRQDHVETVLLHIIRGAGTAGLVGLEPNVSMDGAWGIGNGAARLVRPLLCATREETHGYCTQRALQSRCDSSNLSLSFVRNRIRRELLPMLRSYNPAADSALERLSRLAREDELFIRQQVDEWWLRVAKCTPDGVDLQIDRLVDLPGALQSRLIRKGIETTLGSTRDMEATHIDSVRNFFSKTKIGKELALPHGLVCRRSYGVLSMVMRGARTCPTWPQGDVPIKVPGETRVAEWRIESEVTGSVGRPTADSFVAQLDLEKAGTRLHVRKRRNGDRFQPLGMSGQKKLQDFMVDVKVPRWERDCVPLVCSPQQIVWVVGWRIDNRVKVTDGTKAVLRISFSKS